MFVEPLLYARLCFLPKANAFSLTMGSIFLMPFALKNAATLVRNLDRAADEEIQSNQ